MNLVAPPSKHLLSPPSLDLSNSPSKIPPPTKEPPRVPETIPSKQKEPPLPEPDLENQFESLGKVGEEKNEPVLHMPTESKEKGVKPAVGDAKDELIGGQFELDEDERGSEGLVQDRIRVRAEMTPLKEVRSWEACERVVTKERADFFEFVVSHPRDTSSHAPELIASICIAHKSILCRDGSVCIGIPA